MSWFKRNSTMIFTLECTGKYACINLPFPDFDVLFENNVKKRSFPIYDQYESTTANQDKIRALLSAKLDNYQRMATVSIVCTALGSLCLLTAIALAFYYWMKVPYKAKKDSSSILEQNIVDTVINQS